MRVFLALLFSFASSFAHASDIGSYMEDMAQDRRPKPLIKLDYENSLNGEVDSRFLRPVSQITVDATTPVRFIRAEWKAEDVEPSLLVARGDQRFRLKLGSRFYYEAATETILRALGLATVPRKLVRGLKVEVGEAERLTLAQFLAKIPVRFDWNQNFTDTDDGFEVKIGMLEPEVELLGGWKWQDVKPSEESHQMLLALSWLQCSLIRQFGGDHVRMNVNGTEIWTIQNFRGCLGLGAAVSSPNMYLPDWATIEDDGVRMDNPFLDVSYLEAFKNIDRRDLGKFIERAHALKPAALTKLFEESGFPSPLARLYALKMGARLNSLSVALGELALSGADPGRFSSLPQIENGIVIADFEGFPVDLTQTAIEQLIWELGRKALRPIDAIARQLISTLPFVSFEVGNLGQAHFAPGFMFRMNRAITENPNPTGPNDLYLVKDELDVMITLGIGIERDIRFGTAWASAGPGYRRLYVKVTPRALAQSGEGTFLDDSL